METISPSSFFRTWLHFFGRDQFQVRWTERLRASVGALVGLFCTVGVGQMLGEWVGVNEWVMASLGASALLIFVLPSSPMAQPWAVIGGNCISAMVGITCAIYLPNLLWALPIAAALSILAMFSLRCLHPPAAAVSLIAVLGHITTYRYAIFPVMVDSIVLCLAAVAYNSLTGKRYPARTMNTSDLTMQQEKTQEQLESQLDILLNEYQEVIDVDREKLIKIMKIKKVQNK